jgi:hypothetical protein
MSFVEYSDTFQEFQAHISRYIDQLLCVHDVVVRREDGVLLAECLECHRRSDPIEVSHE